jgi:putative redox protein
LEKFDIMTTMKAVYTGELRCEATHVKSGVTIFTDAPTDNHGKGASFSPTDLLCTSLATCMLTIMGIAAAERDVPLVAVHADIVKTMGSQPRRVVKIEIRFTLSGQTYTAKEQEILKNAALACPVAKSLHPDIDQEIHFTFA